MQQYITSFSKRLTLRSSQTRMFVHHKCPSITTFTIVRTLILMYRERCSSYDRLQCDDNDKMDQTFAGFFTFSPVVFLFVIPLILLSLPRFIYLLIATFSSLGNSYLMGIDRPCYLTTTIAMPYECRSVVHDPHCAWAGIYLNLCRSSVRLPPHLSIGTASIDCKKVLSIPSPIRRISVICHPALRSSSSK